jgi:multiple sugar transport system substrate-binding protein
MNWGVTELPAGPAGEATMAFTVCYGVGAANEHPEESWALVNFLTGATGAEFVAESSFGPMPARPEVAEAYLQTWVPRSENTGLSPEDLQAFVTGADYSHRWQLPVGWNQFTDAFNASLQQAFDGQITVDDLVFEVGLVAEELSAS